MKTKWSEKEKKEFWDWVYSQPDVLVVVKNERKF